MMLLMASPTSQKNRPISFSMLQGGAPIGASHDLVVRPEELARIEPNRVTVHNTLGGAYIDAFGAGVQQIHLSGTTGWRGGPDADGAAKFLALRDSISAWNALRQARLSAAMSPDDVELVLSDSLDQFSVVVAPLEFALHRNKQSPLLMRYQIRLAVVRDVAQPWPLNLDAILKAISDLFGRSVATLASLTGIASAQGASAASLAGMTSSLGSLASAGSAFLSMSQSLLTTVATGASAVSGIITATLAPAYLLAIAVQQAGRNVFSSLASIASLPASTAYQINAIVGGFTSAYCSLVNGLDQLSDMFDIEGLFGASNCSSTGGGRTESAYTVSGSNPFAAIFATGATSAMQTPASAQVTATAGAMDPLTTSLTNAQGAAVLQSITSGVTL